MDWLSRLLELIEVKGRVELRCLYGAPHRIERAALAGGEMAYHVVLAGSAILVTPGPALRLLAGDILVLPHGDAHIVADGGGAPPCPPQGRPGLNVTFMENGGPGEKLDLVCGRFFMGETAQRLLQDYLPRRLIVHTAQRSAVFAPAGAEAQLAALIALLRQETAADQLGGGSVLDALSTALFALILRLACESGEAPRGLLALASLPRLAPALSAIFLQPERPWSLPQLARLCNLSRATFIRHFREGLGHPAGELLTRVRMALAAGELRRSDASTAAVGEKVGYRSEAAFQRVFKKHLGMSPACWRRAGRAAAAAPSGADRDVPHLVC